MLAQSNFQKLWLSQTSFRKVYFKARGLLWRIFKISQTIEKRRQHPSGLAGAASLCLRLFYSFAFKKFSDNILTTFCMYFYAFLCCFVNLNKNEQSLENTGFLSIFKAFFIGGEGEIWTLAPVLPAYTLSRGASSASWVLLRILCKPPSKWAYPSIIPDFFLFVNIFFVFY